MNINPKDLETWAKENPKLALDAIAEFADLNILAKALSRPHEAGREIARALADVYEADTCASAYNLWAEIEVQDFGENEIYF